MNAFNKCLELDMKGGTFVIADLQFLKACGYADFPLEDLLWDVPSGLYEACIVVNRDQLYRQYTRHLKVSGSLVLGDLFPRMGSRYYDLQELLRLSQPRIGKRRTYQSAIGLYTVKRGPYKVTMTLTKVDQRTPLVQPL